ncbi:VOC family protein [Pirellulales bacterium]|nr:VOC family protein [Pirellulales bacterium]
MDQQIGKINVNRPIPASTKDGMSAPAPLHPGALNHVALPTADPLRGARFFCDVLGFQETPRPEFSFRGSWLWRPEVGVMIHLIHDASHVWDASQQINTRSAHLAMQTDDYDQACKQLAAHNVDFVERVLPDYGYRQVFFRDPDGNVIELGEWPHPDKMFG